MNIPFVDLKTQYKEIKPEVDAAVLKVMDHCGFILGPEVKECEEKLCEFTGNNYSLTCANGTDALLMALMAADVKAGDEVITTAFSFIATAEMIVLLGAVPVYVDIESDTFNIDVSKIKEAITDKTKAIIPVSLYGQIPDMNEINKLAEQNNIAVIEDAAQSFGAKYNGKRSCNLSRFACTSFFPAKPLGCYGDGGAVFATNQEDFDKLKKIRMHGDSSRYEHTEIGINGRMDSMQCAVINVKLPKYQWEIEQRQNVAKEYTEAFSTISEIQTPVVRDDRDSVWAQYTLRVSEREKFQAAMKEKGVPTAIHYPQTMPDQPAYKEIGRTHDITEARKAANEVVSLPMHPYLNDEQVTYVIESVKSYFA